MGGISGIGGGWRPPYEGSGRISKDGVRPTQPIQPTEQPKGNDEKTKDPPPKKGK